MAETTEKGVKIDEAAVRKSGGRVCKECGKRTSRLELYEDDVREGRTYWACPDGECD